MSSSFLMRVVSNAMRMAHWLLLASLTSAPIYGQFQEDAQHISPSAPVREIDVTVESEPTILQRLFEQILHEVIPRDYEDTRKWGTTKEVFDGLDVRADGLKITTKRKKKRVRHGTWKRYRVSLVDPDETLHVKLRDPRRIEPGVWSTELLLAARLDVTARLQEWQRDIRLLSVSAQAKADVELKIVGTIATELDPHSISPTIRFRPSVQSAELKMVSFKLERMSKADGFVVRELVGDGIEPLLEDLVREKNDDLVAKLNRQIEKNQDKLRLSTLDPVNELLNRWFAE